MLIEKIKKYLCPAGNGVFTVNTAKERKANVQDKLYGVNVDVEKIWQNQVENLSKHKGATLLGVASDSGGGILRGANWGPLFLREEIYKSNPDVFDVGDIRVIPHLLMDKYLNDKTIDGCQNALYSESNELPVSPLSITMDFCEEFYNRYTDKGLVSLGGDHSVSYPLTKAYLQRRKAQGKKIAIIHFDAHTDLLDQRLGIDICFGSWAYHIIEDLMEPELLYQIGIRSSGKDKEYWEDKFSVQQYWANEVIEKGALKVAKEITEDLKRRSVDEIYISFDIDAIDSRYASATGTPEPDGLEPHESMIILKEICKHFPVGAADLVEIAPFLKTNESIPPIEPDSTIQIGADLVNFFIERVNKYYKI